MFKIIVLIGVIISLSIVESKQHKGLGLTQITRNPSNLLSKVIKDVVDLLSNLVGPITKIINSLIGTDVTPCTKVIFDSIGILANNIVETAVGHLPIVGEFIMKSLSADNTKPSFGLPLLLKSALDLLKDMLDALTKIVKAAIPVVSPIGGLTDLLENTVDKFNTLIKNVVSDLQNIIDSSGNKNPLQIFNPIKGISDPLKNITNQFKDLTSNLPRLPGGGKVKNF